MLMNTGKGSIDEITIVDCCANPVGQDPRRDRQENKKFKDIEYFYRLLIM